MKPMMKPMMSPPTIRKRIHHSRGVEQRGAKLAAPFGDVTLSDNGDFVTFKSQAGAEESNLIAYTGGTAISGQYLVIKYFSLRFITWTAIYLFSQE